MLRFQTVKMTNKCIVRTIPWALGEPTSLYVYKEYMYIYSLYGLCTYNDLQRHITATMTYKDT